MNAKWASIRLREYRVCHSGALWSRGLLDMTVQARQVTVMEIWDCRMIAARGERKVESSRSPRWGQTLPTDERIILPEHVRAGEQWVVDDEPSLDQSR